jgi:hypothetical protein
MSTGLNMGDFNWFQSFSQIFDYFNDFVLGPYTGLLFRESCSEEMERDLHIVYGR